MAPLELHVVCTALHNKDFGRHNYCGFIIFLTYKVVIKYTTAVYFQSRGVYLRKVCVGKTGITDSFGIGK